MAEPAEVAALFGARAVAVDSGNLGKLGSHLVGRERLEAVDMSLDLGAGLGEGAGDVGLGCELDIHKVGVVVGTNY